MTMENDLVERLDKAVERCKAVLKHDLHDGLDTDFALMAQYRLSEASGRIQALEAELARDKKWSDQLTQAVSHWKIACFDTERKLERAEAELARKTEALEKYHGLTARIMAALMATKQRDDLLLAHEVHQLSYAARSALEEKTDV